MGPGLPVEAESEHQAARPGRDLVEGRGRSGLRRAVQGQLVAELGGGVGCPHNGGLSVEAFGAASPHHRGMPPWPPDDAPDK
jgi:hypothetical protein